MDTDCTKKDTTDIKCLSSGNTLLIKIDSINVIQNQFDKFLEKFVGQEKIYHDAKLPLFIVHNFSKLFKHWLEFPDLRKQIGENVFEEIFREMANVFEPRKSGGCSNLMSPDSQFDSALKESNGTSRSCPPNKKSNGSSALMSESQSAGREKSPSALSYFKLFCNDCNDNVPIVNGDPCLSYKLHVQSEEHSKCGGKPHIRPLNINDTENAAPSNAVVTQNTNMDLKGSSDGDDVENLKPVDQYKLPTLYDPFCEPCCKNISAKELFIGNHLESKSHERHIMLYEESKKILQEYGYYFSITNKDTFEFRCHICMIKQSGTHSFIQHCSTVEHQRNLQHTKGMVYKATLSGVKS